jgi:hypothetical protein
MAGTTRKTANGCDEHHNRSDEQPFLRISLSYFKILGYFERSALVLLLTISFGTFLLD